MNLNLSKVSPRKKQQEVEGQVKSKRGSRPRPHVETCKLMIRKLIKSKITKHVKSDKSEFNTASALVNKLLQDFFTK